MSKITAYILAGGPGTEQWENHPLPDILICMNRTATRWQGDFWVSLDALPFRDLTPIGRPILVTEQQVIDTAKRERWACARWSWMSVESLQPVGYYQLPPQATLTICTALRLAYTLRVCDTTIFGAAWQGSDDFDGPQAIGAELNSRPPERWMLERAEVEAIMDWMTERGCTARRHEM